MDLIIILIVCIITGGVVIIIYKFWQDLKLLKTVTRPTRGTRSERKMVISLLKNGFPPQNIFHDLSILFIIVGISFTYNLIIFYVTEHYYQDDN